MSHKVSHNDVTKATRRSFLHYVLGGSFTAFVGAILYPISRYLIPPAGDEPKPRNALAASVGELKPNSGKVFRFGNEPAILINTPKGELRAFTAVCTHLACTVQYREDFEHIWCACHDGHYDLNGMNIKGPPPRPLTPYKVNIKDEEVFVSKES